MTTSQYCLLCRTCAQPVIAKEIKHVDSDDIDLEQVRVLAAGYCAEPVEKRLEWAARGDALVKDWLNESLAPKARLNEKQLRLRTRLNGWASAILNCFTRNTFARLHGRTTYIQLAKKLTIDVPAYCTSPNTTKQRTQRAEALKILIGALDSQPETVDNAADILGHLRESYGQMAAATEATERGFESEGWYKANDPRRPYKPRDYYQGKAKGGKKSKS